MLTRKTQMLTLRNPNFDQVWPNPKILTNFDLTKLIFWQKHFTSKLKKMLTCKTQNSDKKIGFIWRVKKNCPIHQTMFCDGQYKNLVEWKLKNV